MTYLQAVVLIGMEVGMEDRICNELLRLPEVKKVHLTDGPYDALLMVEGHGPAQIGRFVVDKIRPLRGVNGTTTEMIEPFKMAGRAI